ncbi:MAG: lysophospholipid acyltransferase family protein [Flavobacteriales bacterium]
MPLLYFIYKLWIGLVFWVTLLLLYPFFFILLSRQGWFGAAFRLKRFWSLLIRALIFCPMRVQYATPLPPPPYVIVSNHCSHLDTVFMYGLFSDYFIFMGKGELLKWPLFRLFFRKMDIPVMRSNHRLAYLAWQSAARAIDNGSCVAIYPEATIPVNTPHMKHFKNGAFRLAVEKNVPLVAITWQTNFKILSDPSRIFSHSLPHRIIAVVHSPIYASQFDGDITAVRNHTFQTIKGALTTKQENLDSRIDAQQNFEV